MSDSDSEPRASDELVASIHNELRSLARLHMAGETPGHTLQVTALVSEAFLRLRDRLGAARRDPAWFYLIAADAMRRVLIEHARRKKAHRRGGDLSRLQLDLAEVADTANFEQVVAVNDAIVELGRVSPRSARIVRLRFYTGLREEEVAAVMGLSRRTVRREWAFARAWLFRALRGVSDAR